jgi:hypothetical protein
MKFLTRKTAAKQAPASPRPAQGQGQGPARWKQAQKDIEALRRRVAAVEQELQEARQLNRRLAEIVDVVAEVLLPAEQRDEERLRAILAKYDESL